jgi:hypothetical protein
MRRLTGLICMLLLAGCGGGDKSSGTLTVMCTSGTQLVGATSVTVLGDLANGSPAMEFPDPANVGKTGAIAVPPHNSCKITPSGG